MYTLAVSDHIMIAHSFRGEVFGPAQKIHGATYEVEVAFSCLELDQYGLVCDIGLALQALKAILAGFNYRNLDDLPELTGQNTTTEFMAGEIFRRMKQSIQQGMLGSGTENHLQSMKIVVHESPVAWASFEDILT